ncbi:MAG: hypothetical protein ACRD2B_10875 [Terriglobia bacterium]
MGGRGAAAFKIHLDPVWTGKGWLAPQQLQVIKLQHLALPQLEVIRKQAIRLRDTRIR